jgi:hypothetical protein
MNPREDIFLVLKSPSPTTQLILKIMCSGESTHFYGSSWILEVVNEELGAQFWDKRFAVGIVWILRQTQRRAPMDVVNGNIHPNEISEILFPSLITRMLLYISLGPHGRLSLVHANHAR